MKILDTIKAVRTVALSHLWCLDPLDWPQFVCVCLDHSRLCSIKTPHRIRV